MPDDDINWSALARKYGIRLANKDNELKNGGQVLKEYLRQKGVNVDRFDVRSCSTPRIRRKRKRCPGGEIYIPITPSVKNVNELITKKITEGEYDLGELIIPNEISKLKLADDGTFLTEVIAIEGRKIPLQRIRQRLLDQQEKSNLLRARKNYHTKPIEEIIIRLKLLDEFDDALNEDNLRLRLKELETTRYLSCWADHSSIASHSYVLYTFSCLYDEAVFVTNDEVSLKCGVDVEELIGKPQIHVIARCGSSDESTRQYAEERRKCLDSLNKPVTTSTGIDYNDVLRYFTGDMPALAAESGQQYGGHYPCGNCGSHVAMFDDCAFILRRPLLSLSDRLTLFYKGKYGSNTKCRPFDTLTKEELVNELATRKLDGTGNKKELTMRLQKDLGGIQRVPTLLFNTSVKTLDEIGLGQYEITLTEPLHDYSNHIKNILTEIPAHLSKQGRKTMESIMTAIFKDKQTIRGCDYHDAAVVLPRMMRDQQAQLQVPSGTIELLETLSEIGRILYSRESQRTSQSILRLHLVTWKHWILLKELLSTPKKLTRRKIWGYYSHALLAHAPILYRVICTRQLNTEDEERIFGTLKDITKRTSSMRPGEIEYNALIRIQEELKQKDPSASYDKVVTKHAAQQSKPVNTVITENTMRKHSHHWQALLENISDYLNEGEGIWWKRLPNGDVEFYDITVQHMDAIPPNPSKKFFRSSNTTSITAYLASKWMECVTSKTTLPLVTFHDYHLHTNENTDSITFENEEEESATESQPLPLTINETEEFEACEQRDTAQQLAEPENYVENSPHGTHSPALRSSFVELESMACRETPARKRQQLKPVQHLPANPVSSTPYTYETKLGNALCKLFEENSKESIDIDKAKSATKQQPHSKLLRRKHSAIESKISTMVLQMYGQCDRDINEWEKTFIREQSRFPTKSDISRQHAICQKYKQKQIAKDLLHQWKITIHL